MRQRLAIIVGQYWDDSIQWSHVPAIVVTAMAKKLASQHWEEYGDRPTDEDVKRDLQKSNETHKRDLHILNETY